MRYLRKAPGLTLLGKVRNNDIRKKLQVKPLLLHIQLSQFRWPGHVFGMAHSRLPRKVFQVMFKSKRPFGRPQAAWRKYIKRLCGEQFKLRWNEVEAMLQNILQWKKLFNELQSRPHRIKRNENE